MKFFVIVTDSQAETLLSGGTLTNSLAVHVGDGLFRAAVLVSDDGNDAGPGCRALPIELNDSVLSVVAPRYTLMQGRMLLPQGLARMLLGVAPPGWTFEVGGRLQG